MFQDVLGKAQEEKFMVSIATYGEEAAWVGYVLSYTLELVTLEHVSKYGRYDGIRSLKIDNIEIVYKNESFIIFNKPNGLLTHPTNKSTEIRESENRIR